MDQYNVSEVGCVMSSEFDAWLQASGVVAYDIKAAFVAEGWRGIAAVKQLPAGALILQVPERVLMSTSSAARDAAFTAATQKYPDHGQALQAPYAQQNATATCQQAQQSWTEAKGLLSLLGLPKKWCSLKAWLWASSTVCSRTMHVPFSSAGALTPFGDLHNYHPPPPPHYPEIEGVSACCNQDRVQDYEDYGDGGYSESFQEYCLYARKRYCKGEQVFLCYGKYTNLELLEHYGFVLAHNPHDEAHLPLSAFPSSFASYLEQQRRTARHCFLHCNGIPGWQLLQDLRCYAATVMERKQLVHLAVAGERISLANDTEVFKVLRSVCDSVLSQLGSTLGQDEEFLQQAAANDCMQAAISWRVSYKRCLHAGVQCQHTPEGTGYEEKVRVAKGCQLVMLFSAL
ncbi:hypothetical protein WJX77_005489 [Trebouxia sp. C0004]